MKTPDKLKELRNGFDEEVRRFVIETMFDIEERLLTALPQMAKSVLDSGKQATYSPTVTFKKGKRETLKVTVAARVRLPDESKEFLFRLGAQGQLELAMLDDVEPDETPEERAAEMNAEAFGDLEEAPPFAAEREPEEEPPLFTDAAPVQRPAPAAPAAPAQAMTPAQERLAAIRATNLALARAGKLTPAQMEAARITPEDLEQQQDLEEVANA